MKVVPVLMIFGKIRKKEKDENVIRIALLRKLLEILGDAYYDKHSKLVRG